MTNGNNWKMPLMIAPLYAAQAAFGWFVVIDRDIPITLLYQHERFTIYPVNDRAEADAHGVDVVRSGTQLWIYREFCVTGHVHGTVRALWVAGNFGWPSPERPIEDPGIGCWHKSVGLIAPTSNPSRDFVYRPEWTFRVNWLLDRDLPLPEIRLRVLSPEDATAAGL